MIKIQDISNLPKDYPSSLESELTKPDNAVLWENPISLFEVGFLCGSSEQVTIQSAIERVQWLIKGLELKLISKSEKKNLFLALASNPDFDLYQAIFGNDNQPLQFSWEFKPNKRSMNSSNLKRSVVRIIEEEESKEIKPHQNGYQKRSNPVEKRRLEQNQDILKQSVILRKTLEAQQQEETDRLLAQLYQSEGSMIFQSKVNQVKVPEMNCEICLEGLFSKEIIGFKTCGHVFHILCIHEFVKNAVHSKKTTIKCPHEKCPYNLTMDDIEEVIDGIDLQKYQQNQLEMYIAENSDELSYCPTPGCNYVFIHDGESDFRCPKCNSHYCLDCRVNYHTGRTCIEYKAEKVNNTFSKADAQFIEFVKGAKYKQCAKCKFWVERTDGCLHMTCKCGHEFCYKCGAKHKTCPC